METTNNDSIIARVKKILALAEKSSGATEEERMTAMKMACALMAQHGIDQQTILGSKTESKARFGKNVTKPMQPHQVYLAQAAGYLYGCKIMVYNRGRQGFVFVGRPDNIEAAELTTFWLISQVDSLFKQDMRARNYDIPIPLDKWRNQFKFACATRVSHRAKEYADNPALLTQATGKNALVLGDYFKKLQQEATETMGPTKSAKISVKQTSSEAYWAGHRAGDRVQLHNKVTNHV